MLIGLTYDLRADYLAAGYTEEETAEFDRGDTIEALEGALAALGHRTVRIGHIRALVDRLAAGDRWDLVFNIAEGLHGFAREAQIPALLEAYDIPCTFSDALVNALTLHKAFTKQVLRDAGIPTTDFALVRSESDIARVRLPFPLFVKPVAEGTAKGVDSTSKVNTPAELDSACRKVLANYRQPALVEPYLPGREFTTGIVGTGDEAEAIGTIEVVMLEKAEAHSYTYVNKENCEELCLYELAEESFSREAANLSLAAWRAVEGRDAGRIDLRCDATGKMQVMEINTLPGLHPEHSDLPILCTKVGMPYLELMRKIMASAEKRVAQPDRRSPNQVIASAEADRFRTLPMPRPGARSPVS